INASLSAAYFLIRAGMGAVAQMIKQALEDVGRRRFVDKFGAAAAGEISLNHAALDGGGRQPLVPEGKRQLGMRHEVLGELPHALRARAVAPIERQRQADNNAADAMACDL